MTAPAQSSAADPLSDGSWSAGTVRRQTDGPVAVLTPDRPAKLNALTSGMTAELRGQVAAVNDDADIGPSC
jgi:enoyl-CoA hydratase/carnithine racemase